MFCIVVDLNLSTLPRNVHSLLHRPRYLSFIGVKYDMAIGISRSSADNLNK